MKYRMKTLRIATRKSRLALWQAECVKTQLALHYPGLEIIFVPMSTRGDQILDRPLADIGGKALFVKGLEAALLNKDADIAVHSMKDMPADTPAAFTLAAILERSSPFDAFISTNITTFDALPHGAVLGTSSYRRQAQLKALRPDLKIKALRGNVETRLAKMQAGEVDAMILAEAGLRRLELDKHIRHVLSPELCLPSAGQGAIGIECLSNDQEIAALVSCINHANTFARVSAERAMNLKLNGDCHAPIGAYAEIIDGQLWLRAVVAAIDGSEILASDAHGPIEYAKALGTHVAESLLSQGAARYLS